MSKKKKIDLSTELADLIMGDEKDGVLPPEPAHTRTVVKDLDPDPTIAISKASQEDVIKPPPLETAGKDIDVNAEVGEGTKTKLTPAEPKSEVKEFSQIFSPKTKVTAVPQSTSSQVASPTHSGAPHGKRSSTELILTAEASLVQSDHLRIAQERILELEKVVETLRADNEELIAAGETLKNRTHDLQAQLDRIQQGTKEKSEMHHEELVVLRANLTSKNEELSRAKLKIEELETRLSGDLKKIRVRERELENRLELVKLESQAVIKNKDEIVLDLKRKIDQLNYELENYRSKGKELNRVLDDNRERVRRTVKALRLALSMLEGEEEDNPLKKAE